MSLLARLLAAVGVLSLVHAAYSAHEHSTLSTKLHQTNAPLPLDIKIETLIAILMSCVGLVLSSEPFKPISWSTWAGNIEKNGGGSNPFRTLEDRVGFMDIRAKRKDFADWVRQSGAQVKN